MSELVVWLEDEWCRICGANPNCSFCHHGTSCNGACEDEENDWDQLPTRSVGLSESEATPKEDRSDVGA